MNCSLPTGLLWLKLYIENGPGITWSSNGTASEHRVDPARAHVPHSATLHY